MSRKMISLMLAAAQIMAAASNPYDARIDAPPKPKAPIPTENQKKCKSCKYIDKNAYGKYACPVHSYVQPQNAACDRYEKRKKK